MKLLILGATGQVGRLLVDQALEQGHEVVAFVRNPAKLKTASGRLTFFKGDARDPRAIAAAMARTDAVLSALGHTSAAKSDVFTAATSAVLANLKPGQRFISLSGFGVADPRDPKHPWHGRLINALLRRVPGELMADAERHAELLRQSSADWVLVRATPMIPGSPTHRYRTGYFPVGLTNVTVRADVADFMLANLATDKWLRQAPIIASR